MNEREHNYGLDFARILAMSLVILFHMVESGMFGCESRGFVCTWAFGWSACCVNFFGLLTGFLCVDRPWRWTKIFSLWGQVAVLGIGTSLCCGDFRLSHLIYDACPFMFLQYWYFRAYVFLFFLIPLLNCGLLALPRRTLNVLCGALGVFIILSSLSRYDCFVWHRGFSPMWLVVLYIFGAACKLNLPILAKVPFTGAGGAH